MVTRSILQGLLSPVLRERVNMVNAELAAETRGITVTEGKVKGEGRMNRVAVRIGAGKESFTAAGMVTPDNQPHITEVEGYQFDTIPAPYMIFARNDDKPGMIGQIGTLLGAGHVNIATMQVSRKKKEGTAMMVLTVDSAVMGLPLRLYGTLTVSVMPSWSASDRNCKKDWKRRKILLFQSFFKVSRCPPSPFF